MKKIFMIQSNQNNNKKVFKLKKRKNYKKNMLKEKEIMVFYKINLFILFLIDIIYV